MRRYRKDRCLEQVLARILEKSRIALAPDDLIIDPACFFARPNFADQLLSVLPDRKLDDRSCFRDRKEVCSLKRVRSIVSEYLLDPRCRHLAGDLRIKLDRLYW